jgi:hypothetical protein
MLKRDLLPHIGPNFRNKALFLGYMIYIIKDMRNSIMKELNSGPWKSNKNIENIINSTNLYKILKSTTIESGLKYHVGVSVSFPRRHRRSGSAHAAHHKNGSIL